MWRTVVKGHKLPKRDERRRYLSGICNYQLPIPADPLARKKKTNGRPFLVPRDRNKAVTDKEQVIDRLGKSIDTRIWVHAANLWDDRNQDIYPHGFPVHAYCWRVVEQIIGSAAEENLEIFLQTLRERWQENPFEVDTCVYKQQWFGTIAGSGQLIPENLIATANPDDIPEIKNIIQSATEETAHKRGRGRLRVQTPFDLPLDVQLLIIDCLRPRDARNALDAMGWRVPLSYWQGRAALSIKYIHEVEDVKSEEEVDREFLYQEAEELLENKAPLPYGLKNRLRIFRILEGTKKSFFFRLAKVEDSLKN